jgi:hypothetical protein
MAMVFQWFWGVHLLPNSEVLLFLVFSHLFSHLHGKGEGIEEKAGK